MKPEDTGTTEINAEGAEISGGLETERHIVKWTARGHRLDFSVFEEETYSGISDNPEYSGTVKWDGCTNIEFHSCMHYCEPQHFIDQHEILKQVYILASNFIPNFDGVAWEDKK